MRRPRAVEPWRKKERKKEREKKLDAKEKYMNSLNMTSQ
jgi:hypothetical protein